MVEKSSVSAWKCRKGFILRANPKRRVEQGYTTARTRWDYTTELCGSESLPVCCSQCTSREEQQQKVSLRVSHPAGIWTRVVFVCDLCSSVFPSLLPPSPLKFLNLWKPSEAFRVSACLPLPTSVPTFAGETHYLLITTGHVRE